MNLNTQNIPELQFFEGWKEINKSEYNNILETYQGLIELILTIPHKDIEYISKTREYMAKSHIKRHSASNLFTPDFLENIQKQPKVIQNLLKDCFSFDLEDSKTALKNLQEMLKNGSSIAMKMETKPIDGDKVWDNVIWGHTQAKNDVDKKVLVHFTISHYLCQYMNITLGKEYSLNEKDDFINILADLILLNQSQDPKIHDIYKIWSTKRDQGGLAWVDEKQLNAYKRI